MRCTVIPTDYMIIKAETTAEFVCCDFAIIHITKEWKELLKQRIELASQFKGIPNFSRITFMESPLGFYEDNDFFSIHQALGENTSWAYLLSEDNELENFTECDNHLNSFLIHIDTNGFVFYSANAEYTGEEYYTYDFFASHIL